MPREELEDIAGKKDIAYLPLQPRQKYCDALQDIVNVMLCKI